MATENRFNLIDEPWIPVVDVGLVSLKQLFGSPHYRGLGGNPVQKIALTKLLLAIAQSAYTPVDDDDWAQGGVADMAKKCLDYLEKWHDRFWLYGEKPFLQMPAVLDLIKNRTDGIRAKAKNESQRLKADAEAVAKPFGSGFYPDIPSENNTLLTQNQFEKTLSDAEKCVFIVSLMNFAFGGKRVEKDLLPLSAGYQGKSKSAKSAPSIGNHWGYLHSYLISDILLQSVWINLLTKKQIDDTKCWTSGLGIPPWESMPNGENCDEANNLKNSYMGCLVAMSRFVLLHNKGIYYVEGIQYPSHKNGWREPSIAINGQGKDIKLLWVDPQKRPWRELTALLSFIDAGSQRSFDCQQITGGLTRARLKNLPIGIWSGGLRLRANAGDQSVKQDDDFVESYISLPSNKTLQEDGIWFNCLKTEMAEINNLSKIVYGATLNFFRAQKSDNKEQAALAGNLFWQFCEHQFQNLITACAENDENKKLRLSLRKTFAGFAQKSYDTFCPKDTARQLDAWAQHKPNLGKYLSTT